jgi:hypothetical protein
VLLYRRGLLFLFIKIKVHDLHHSRFSLLKEDITSTSRQIELIRNIHWVNVVFNLYTEKPEETGECGINVIVNRTSTSVQIFVVQRISRYFVQSLIGAMVLEPLSKKSWFAMNNEEIHSHGMFEQI